MIVQYRGYDGNWCYKQSSFVSCARIEIKDIITQPRETIEDLFSVIYDHVCSKTGFLLRNRDVDFIDDENIVNANHVIAITLDEKRIYITTHEVYILNDQGGTVQHIV